jgi:hypothetical protein
VKLGGEVWVDRPTVDADRGVFIPVGAPNPV